MMADLTGMVLAVHRGLPLSKVLSKRLPRCSYKLGELGTITIHITK